MHATLARTVYIYVVCSLELVPGIQNPDAEKRVVEILTRNLRGKAFDQFLVNRNPYAVLTAQTMGQVAEEHGIELPERRRFQESWAQNACNIFGNQFHVINEILHGVENENEDTVGDGLDGMTLAEVLSTVPAANTVRGALFSLLHCLAVINDRDLLDQGGHRPNNCLMILHRYSAALACQDKRTILPKDGDVICYEMRCFPQGAVTLQSSAILN